MFHLFFSRESMTERYNSSHKGLHSLSSGVSMLSKGRTLKRHANDSLALPSAPSVHHSKRAAEFNYNDNGVAGRRASLRQGVWDGRDHHCSPRLNWEALISSRADRWKRSGPPLLESLTNLSESIVCGRTPRGAPTNPTEPDRRARTPATFSSPFDFQIHTFLLIFQTEETNQAPLSQSGPGPCET